MHICYRGGSGRNDSYKPDPKIPSDIQQYSKSYSGGCNKGHMIASNERTISPATNKQVFYYSNIAPQYSSTFNTGGGAWNNLEELVNDYWCTDTLYQVVGCYFDTYTDAYGKTATPKTAECGGQDTSIPTMFYMALLRTKGGRTGKSVMNCSANELQCVAFVMRHTMEKGHEPEARDLISIAELEKITGFTYFPNVPNAPKTTFKASDWDL
jgi:DNA/RNA endonuclease G (NUC1)